MKSLHGIPIHIILKTLRELFLIIIQEMNKNLILSISLLIISLKLHSQFGTIGYDFNDPYVSFADLNFAVRLSTDNNIYCPNPEELNIEKISENEIILKSNSLSAAGGQLISKGFIELKIERGTDQRIKILASARHNSELAKSILVLIKGIDVKYMVSEQIQAKGVQEFIDKKGIRVSYPSRSATMPLVFLTTPNEWYVLSKDKKIRRKGFACSYDYLSNEPVFFVSHDSDMRKRSRLLNRQFGFGKRNRKREEIVKERCIDLEKYFDIIPYAKKNNQTRWIDGLKVVTFLHGVHWTGHLFNTYDQMGEQLGGLQKRLMGVKYWHFYLLGMDDIT